MFRPFEAMAAFLLGALLYAAVVVAYHVTTGTPAIWRLELTALAAFFIGACASRYLWK